MKIILRLFSFLRPFVKEVTLSILAGIVTIGTGIGMLGTSAYLISFAALQPSIAELQVAIVGVRFFGITRSVFRYLERLISHSVNLKLLARMRVWFYRNLEPGAPANIQSLRGGDLLNRVMSDLETLENFYVRVVSPVIVAFVITVGMSLFLGGYFLPLGAILFSGMVLNGLVLPVLMILGTRKTGSDLINNRAELSAEMLETFQGLEDLQSTGAQNRWLERIKELDNKSARFQLFYGFLTGMNSGLVLLISNLTVLAVVIAAIPRVQSGEMTGISLAVVTLLTMASFEATGTLPQAAQNLTASYSAAKRLFELVEISAETQKPDLPEELILKARQLRLHQINLAYPENPQAALVNLDLSLEKGRKVALVGPSGAGKTSVTNLLLSFYPFTSGSIYLDDLNLEDFSSNSTRKLYGVISQSTYLFSDTLRSNLLLANQDAKSEDLLKVLQKVKMDKWLESLPDGLDTWLGDQGLQMSGGERQRLAIARVLLQTTPFVLLDEPTANLDPITEKEILDELFSIFADRGLLIITHRLVRMEQMDQILFLKNGRIIESGKHDVLLRKKGEYYKFFSLQKNFLEGYSE